MSDAKKILYGTWIGDGPPGDADSEGDIYFGLIGTDGVYDPGFMGKAPDADGIKCRGVYTQNGGCSTVRVGDDFSVLYISSHDSYNAGGPVLISFSPSQSVFTTINNHILSDIQARLPSPVVLNYVHRVYGDGAPASGKFAMVASGHYTDSEGTQFSNNYCLYIDAVSGEVSYGFVMPDLRTSALSIGSDILACKSGDGDGVFFTAFGMQDLNTRLYTLRSSDYSHGLSISTEFGTATASGGDAVITYGLYSGEYISRYAPTGGIGDGIAVSNSSTRVAVCVRDPDDYDHLFVTWVDILDLEGGELVSVDLPYREYFQIHDLAGCGDRTVVMWGSDDYIFVSDEGVQVLVPKSHPTSGNETVIFSLEHDMVSPPEQKFWTGFKGSEEIV